MELILFIGGIIFLIIILNMRDKNNTLLVRIKRLESLLLAKKILTPSDFETHKPTPESPPTKANAPSVPLSTIPQNNFEAQQKVNPKLSQPSKSPITQKSPSKWVLWLQDNWTGALGISILVLSVVFGCLYLGLSSSPFTRFLMILSFATLFLVGSTILRRKKQWQDFALWLQGAGGSLILVAFLGSSYFEVLQFYHDPALGFIMLGIGLFSNILLAYLTPKQTSSVFHVSLSLLALNFAPSALPVLYAATTVAFTGLILSYRKKWDWNILGCTLAFAVFFLNWWFNQPSLEDVRIHSIIAACIIGLSGIFVPYGKIYRNAPHSALTLSAHLIPWITLGINTTLFSSGVSWASAIVASASILCFFLAQIARKNNLSWLYTCDTLIAQTLALLAIGLLHRLIPNLEVILWIGVIEVLLFTTVTNIIQQNFLRTIGKVVLGLLVFVHVSNVLTDFSNQHEITEMLWLRILVLAALFYLARFYQSKHTHTSSLNKSFDMMLDGSFFIYATILIVFITKLSISPFIYIALGIALERTLRNTQLITQKYHRTVLYALALEILGVCWYQMSNPDLSMTHSAIYTVTSLIFLLSLYPGRVLEGFPTTKTRLDDIWVYVFGIHLAIGSYLLLRPLSDFLPGILMLGLSLISFEAGRILLNMQASTERRALVARGLINVSAIFLIAFMILYITLYIQSEASLGQNVSLRLSISLAAILVSLYTFLSAKKAATHSTPVTTLWDQKYEKWLASLPADFALYLSVILVALELPTAWHPFFYALFGVLISFNGFTIKWPERFVYYRIALLIASAIYVAGVVSTWNTPLELWYYDTRLTGILSICVATTLAYRLTIDLSAYKAASFNKVMQLIQKDPTLFSFLIPFISFAFFLYWRFDHAILTAFWVGEIFTLVSLGLLLKHKRLVQLSLALLLFCVARLVIYDLSQTDLLARTIVFAAVGALMTGIHVLYKKFSPRLK